ncbi:MAG: T9SS type A sorting domain-containing protein [Bacteroidota bacterium]|nr:T9SS type A sorting domain-containing protein [Bacteroidota bacterium]MDP4233142.1 T9SS type A sorting domain-containing protein [Bacteroidota bacterium]MDP4241713.1 T9SS type A sorting domain-containing protein [Bacteroidota bacterium]MDP4287371.1 T9SS type A sorting domain-containing protein [Bacteroidota bacterium]
MNIRALVIAGLVFLGTSFTVRAQNYQIVRSVIAAGATPMSNGTYAVDGTIGQAVIGIAQSGVFTNYQGFWYTFRPTGGVKINYDANAEGFALEQNYPNPFNPSTTIKFSVPERTKVTIRVMNLLGEEVHSALVDEVKDPGTYSIEFSDADNLPSGTYIYRMDAGTFTASKRMVLLK